MVSFQHLALAFAIAALAAPARAAPPCQRDAGRFCAGRAPAELLSCLQAHRADLAPACVARVERVLLFFQGASVDCKPDAYERCPAVGPGLPMIDCLRASRGKLTKRCEAYLDVLRDKDAAVERACRDELARGCPGTTPGRGELWMCLGLGAVEVSESCAAVL